MTTRRKLLVLGVANLLVFAAAAALVEGVGRVWLASRPAYDVVFLQADRELGWKQVPGHAFTWAGTGWYAREFSVPVRVNSRGFRDREHEVGKPAGLRRVALLGDSFVEAMQVPFEKTAAQLLEARLNEEDPPWEVLDFGISNYGLGQYLLVWETQAREFDPDFVFVLLADIQLHRTVDRFESGAFASTSDRRLWVRPTFRLAGDELVREPARDFAEFQRAQAVLIENEFGGERSRVRERSVLGHYLEAWFGERRDVFHDLGGKPALAVNRRILRELARQTRLAGSRLVLVDMSRYLGPESSLPAMLRAFAKREQIGYVDLSAALARANESGTPTRWKYDAHFNEAGNEVFASALYDWLNAAASAGSR